jgi:multidrug transporter EmrE-like cation transporter
MIRSIGLLTIAILFNGVANVLMKAGMRNAPETQGLAAMAKHYLTSWPVMVGIVLFALNVLAYTQVLAKLPLSIAYPIMVSMTGLIVILGSVILFKESITVAQWAGFALIIGGVICVYQ